MMLIINSQERRAQSQPDGSNGTAEIDVVLGRGGHKNVPGEGKGRGQLSKLRENPRENRTLESSRVRYKRFQANVQRILHNDGKLFDGQRENRSGTVPVRPSAQQHFHLRRG